jgi:hypothetical protein
MRLENVPWILVRTINLQIFSPSFLCLNLATTRPCVRGFGSLPRHSYKNLTTGVKKKWTDINYVIEYDDLSSSQDLSDTFGNDVNRYIFLYKYTSYLDAIIYFMWLSYFSLQILQPSEKQENVYLSH